MLVEVALAPVVLEAVVGVGGVGLAHSLDLDLNASMLHELQELHDSHAEQHISAVGNTYKQRDINIRF